ncbi:MAG: hypothetical protein JXN59_11725 [Anaerolineae bacterium]|nr:hypothetical protein [Anaerolineae bacterium]
MYPEDRVLVGVINRKIDFDHVKNDHWYRIPCKQLDHGVHAEYLAFYQSRSFGADNGRIRYFARRTGHELVRRVDLLPEEPNHPRAKQAYYKLQLGELREKLPPVVNPTRRPVVFVYTTWDRFVAATEIADLYSAADYFVDRVFYALRGAGVAVERSWEAACVTDDGGAQLVVPCRNGELVATTASARRNDRLHLPVELGEEGIRRVIAEVRQRCAALGGALARVRIPFEE